MKINFEKTYNSCTGIKRMHYILVILFLLGSVQLKGQSPAVAQDSLTARFLRYGGMFPREEIYVHTDREEYIAGENIWFKLYLFDGQSGSLSSAAGIAYLEILNSGKSPVVQKKIKLDGGLGSGMAVLSDTLGSGHYTLRAYTNSMKNFMPFKCFSKGIDIYNALNAGTFRTATGLYPESGGKGAPDSPSESKPLYENRGTTPMAVNQVMEFYDPGPVGIREKVVLEFRLTGRKKHPVQDGNLSISVYPSGSEPAPGIAEYLLSASESSRTDRDSASSGNYPALIYKPEKEYHFIRGQLLNRSGQELAAGRYMFLSIPGKNAMFQYSLTDDRGWFEFTLPIENGITDIIIQPENPLADDVIRMEPAFTGWLQASSERLSASRPSTSGSNIMKWGVNYQLRRIFRTDSVVPPHGPEPEAGETKRFYGRPETELFLKDYIDLPLMEEVFFELLDGVQLRSRRSGYEISMTDPVYGKPYEKPPVMFVDGVVISDPSVIAGLEPSMVEKIDVLRSRYVVGDYLFFGLLNIITKAGDFSSVVLPGYAVRMPYRIFDPQPGFWSPSYPDPESRQSRIPDLRNTLYWNPSVRPGDDGRFMVEFWSSDYAVDYEINIQGVDPGGEPVSFRTVLRAKE